ncbi:MAG: hypothetical protein U0744_16225 [Gemmataceae bacterium]
MESLPIPVSLERELKSDTPIPARPMPWGRRFLGYPLSTWLLICLALGVALRGWHFLRNDPMWHDEAALVVNVLEKSYADIWGPRKFNETGPPLFLWTEKAAVAAIGDSTYALRLIPLLAGIAALFVCVRALRPIATPVELLVFALMFGISDRLLWHCTEAKMYSTDALVAALLLLFFVRREKTVPDFAEGLILAAASSLMFFSFPVVFVLPAYGIARLPTLWRSRKAGAWVGMVLFGGVFFGCFALLAVGPVAAIRTADLDFGWSYIFPDWQRWWTVPHELLRRTWEAFRYTLEPVGHVLMPFAVWGGIALKRRGHGPLAAFLWLTIGFNIIAWLAGKYPLGPTRVNTFLAPACLTLIAVGVGDLFERVFVRLGPWAWLVPLPILAAIILAVASLILPWRRLQMDGPAELVLSQRTSKEPVVAWFWEHHYYFREIGDWRRDTPPKIDDPELEGVWYLHHTTAKPHHLQDPFWPDLVFRTSKDWTSEVTRFRDYDVWHFRRKPKE